MTNAKPLPLRVTEEKLKLRMEDNELLIASIIGTVLFVLVIRYMRRRVAGTASEQKIKRHLRTISIVYGVLMAIQVISLIADLYFRS